MKERPILFNAAMVRAVLDGSKTQTRRIIKPQPTHFNPAGVPRRANPAGGPSDLIASPFGQLGEHLWVRETWLQPGFEPVIYKADAWAKRLVEDCKKNPSAPQLKWKPSIHMPRAASRIQLEITGARVERLNDCSEADAIAEGIKPNWCGDLADWNAEEHGWVHYLNGEDGPEAFTAVESYQSLWELINGPGSWAANPWVWVVEFRRLMP